MRSIFILLSTILVALALATPPGNKALDEDVIIPSVSRQDWNWVLSTSNNGCQYLNELRARHGRHALYFSAGLTRLASRHSAWMARTFIFQHQNLNGLGTYINGGRTWMTVTAENIAMSRPRSSNVAWDAHVQWWHSPPHFQNMLGTKHTHCGVGIRFDSQGRWWGTQLFGYSGYAGHDGGSLAAAPVAPAPAPAPDVSGGSRMIPGQLGTAPAPASTPAPAPAPASASGPSVGGGPSLSPSTDDGIGNIGQLPTRGSGSADESPRRNTGGSSSPPDISLMQDALNLLR